MIEDVKKRKMVVKYLFFWFEGRGVWNMFEGFWVCCCNQVYGRNNDLEKCKNKIIVKEYV